MHQFTYSGKITVIFILILLAGCQKQLSFSFLDLNSCAPPCWNGVELGTTTEGEFITILESLQFIDQNKIKKDGGPWSIFENRIIFRSNDNTFLGYAFVQNGRIVAFEFSGELSTTFSQMVDETGEPEYVIVNPVMDYSVVTAINTYFGVSYSFATKDISTKYRGQLSPDILIEMILYFDPNIYNLMLDAGLFSQGHLGREDTLKYMHPWDGYGLIEEKYPSASRD